MVYQADKNRYEKMEYAASGKSGLKLPKLSLGLWHNFGDTAPYENMKALLVTAFDNGNTAVRKRILADCLRTILSPIVMSLSLPLKLVMICGRDLMVTGAAANIF